jgi:hypothetical protein
MPKTLIIVALLLFPVSSYSAIRTWDGGGTDANWQTAANWVGDVTPSAGDDLVFPTTAAQFSPNNNFPLFTTFNSITIEGGTYTLRGIPIRLSNGLNVITGSQMINLSITLSAAQTLYAGPGSTTIVAVLSVGTFGLRIDGDGSFGVVLLSGSGGVNKVGNGVSLISSASLFSGTIFIGNGILVVDANLPGSNVIVEAPTGGLGGTGTVGTVTVFTGAISAGTLASPTGILNSGSITLTSGGNFLCKIGGTTPGANGHDQLNVTGTVALNNARLAPLPWNNFRPNVGDSFLILNNDGSDAIDGTFLNAPEGAVFAGPLNTAFRITYLGGDGNDISVSRVVRAPFDFDGDSRTDVSQFRPSNGTWNILRSQSGTVTAQAWGLATDKLAPADYDGDNRADFAVFRPSDGVWYILNSFTSTVSFITFGLSGDVPAPNDFDGDGFADVAVFRPSTGIWWQRRSLNSQVSAFQFGQDGDLPQNADLDGDGMGDLCVYRPSDGTWHFLQSSTSSYAAFPFGAAGDVPVPADYDGDGRTDAAIFRPTADPAQADFHILLTGPQTYYGVSWGLTGDVPVVADYDGDGRSDVAIFRPSSNAWYLLRSTSGFASVDFGQNGDRPVPAFLGN